MKIERRPRNVEQRLNGRYRSSFHQLMCSQCCPFPCSPAILPFGGKVEARQEARGVVWLRVGAWNKWLLVNVSFGRRRRRKITDCAGGQARVVVCISAVGVGTGSDSGHSAPLASAPPVNKHWLCCSHIPSPAVWTELRGHRGYWSTGSFSKHEISVKRFNLGWHSKSFYSQQTLLCDPNPTYSIRLITLGPLMPLL